MPTYDALGNVMSPGDDELLVPTEFIPLPDAAPQSPISPIDPQGTGPRQGMTFGENVSGAFRSGTLAGVLTENAEVQAARDPSSMPGGFQPSQLKNLPSSVRRRIEQSESPEIVAQRAEAARQAAYEQLAYDLSGTNISAGSVAGTILGSALSPESFGGLTGLLVKQFPKLALRPIATQALDAAIVNTLTDPLVQGARMATGTQDGYDPLQTAAAPVVGAAIGGTIAGAATVVGRAFNRQPVRAEDIGRVAPEQAPEPRVDQTQIAGGEIVEPRGAEPLATIVRPEEAAPAPRAEAAVQPVAPVERPASPDILAEPARAAEPLASAPRAEVPGAGGYAGSLTRDASWVIREKEGGNVLFETFDPTIVSALNVDRYEAVGIREYLGSINGTRSAPEPPPEVLFRKRGTQTPATLPPNQIAEGRPRVDQGTDVRPKPDAIKRVEDMSRELTTAFETVGRVGRVTPGAQGQLNTKTGVARVKSLSDLDTVAHEIGHAFHLDPAHKAAIDPVVAKNRAELTPLGAGDARGNAEAFAELFRLYTMNRPYAAKTYPKATAELDSVLRAKYPDQAAALDTLQRSLDDLHRAPSNEVVSADSISTKPPNFSDKIKKAIKSDADPSGRTLYTIMDALYTGAVDNLHPVYKAVQGLADIAKANGKTVDMKPADNAYILARLTAGSHGASDTMLKFGVIPAGGIDPEGPSLAAAISHAIGDTKWNEEGLQDFGAYLISRRMVAEYERFLNGEIPNRPGKFSLADYQKAVAEFETANPAMKEAAGQVYEFLDRHLQRAFDKGLFTKAYVDAARSRRDYVPFVRDMSDFAQEPNVGGGGGSQNLRTSLMKTFKGSDRSVQNPLESIMKKVHDIEFAIARNDTVNAIARLAEASGYGSGAIAEPIPSQQLRAQRVDVIEALKSAGKTAGLDETDTGALIVQAEDLLGDSTFATLFRPDTIKEGGEPILFHWVDGERRALRLGDGKLGREMYHALTAMHDTERGIFEAVLHGAASFLRAGVTGAPEFIITNFIRDQFTATGTAGRKYIPFASAVGGAISVIRNSPETKTYSGFGGMSAGAVTEVLERSAFGKNVYGLSRTGVMGHISKVFEISEASTRNGLFKSYMKQAEEMGLDKYNSALYATFKATDYIDFRRFGSHMGQLRRWIPFLNAAIQGTDRETRALGDLFVLETKRARGRTLSTAEMDRLKDARVAFVRVMGMGMVLGVGSALMNADDEEYQSASKFTRATNFLFKIGGQWISVPKPFGHAQTVINAFERGTEGVLRGDPSQLGKWLEAAGQTYSPPVMNPLVGTMMDLPANWNRFRERPIVPYYLQGAKPSEQYTPYTAELSKQIGQVTGWSPMKIEYAVNNLLGSRGRDTLAAGDFVMGKDRPEKQIYDWPILRRFVKNLARGSEATEAFYGLVGDKSGKYEQAENAYRVKIRNGEREGAATYLRNLPDDEKVWTILNTAGIDASLKRLHPMQNAKDRVSVMSGLISQITSNNVVKEEDLDRRDLTRSRRDATPISLTSGIRAKAIEELQSLQIITTRNAMIAVEAEGTKGLTYKSPEPYLKRLEMLSPDIAAEFKARTESKKAYDPAYVRQKWPEMKRRLLQDGEGADLRDLLPDGVKRPKMRKAA